MGRGRPSLPVWKPRAEPYAEPVPSKPMTEHPQPVFRYRAFEDPLFPDSWRVEPDPYTGRGIVYLFATEAEAKACEKRKNKQYLESKRK